MCLFNNVQLFVTARTNFFDEIRKLSAWWSCFVEWLFSLRNSREKTAAHKTCEVYLVVIKLIKLKCAKNKRRRATSQHV